VVKDNKSKFVYNDADNRQKSRYDSTKVHEVSTEVVSCKTDSSGFRYRILAKISDRSTQVAEYK
jgi:hypothetical protein